MNYVDSAIGNTYTLWVKKTVPLFTAYNFTNIDTVFLTHSVHTFIKEWQHKHAGFKNKT